MLSEWSSLTTSEPTTTAAVFQDIEEGLYEHQGP